MSWIEVREESKYDLCVMCRAGGFGLVAGWREGCCGGGDGHPQT